MKDITHYFSDLPSNSESIFPSLNEIIVKHANIDDPALEADNKIRIKRKYDKEIGLMNNKVQIKEKQTKKLIEMENSKGQFKRKMIEDITKTENRFEKKKKTTVSTIKPNRNLEVNESEENNKPKNNEFNHSKFSKSLLTYFSKTRSENLEKDKFIKTKFTIKAEIHKSQNSSSSICNIYDKKTKSFSKTKVIPNLKQLDKVHLVESKASVPKNEKLTSLLQQNKQKWSLRIQLQTDNIHTSDDADIFKTIKQLKLQNKNMKNIKKIPKVLSIKNKDRDSSLHSYARKINKEKYLKIDNKKNIKIEKIKDAVNQKLNHHSTSKQCEIDALHSYSQIIDLEKVVSQIGVLEKDNINEIKKIISVGSIMLPFPKVSHITQLSLENYKSDLTHNFLLRRNDNFKPLFDLSQVKYVLKLDNVMHNSEIVYRCVKSDIEAVLFEIKSYCSDVQALWKFISKLKKCKNSKQSLKINCKPSNKVMFKELSRNDLKNELHNCLWTDKYKPNISTDIVGNEGAVSKLKSWLYTWKSLKGNEDYSSSEEFYTPDWSATNSAPNNQVAVLIGPHGSGKTASVYAIANELGYKVLEVNASSKRTGKKILKYFEEATKSHRVEKLNLKHSFASKSKKETTKISQNSLILMEDVDLVFQEDDGFVSASFHLASTTKRPIVMTLSSSCSYLYKMAPQQLQINFQAITGERLLALLQLITLYETGCKLSQNCLNVLCESGDLRKSLLQLQYILQSCKEYIPFTSLTANNSFWKNMQIDIYKSAMRTDRNRKKKQIFNNESFNNNILDNLVNCLDNFTLMSQLINIDDPTSYLLDLKFEPSISFNENPRLYSSLSNVSLEIGNLLSDTIRKLFVNDWNKSNSSIDTNNHQLLIKKKLNSSINTALSQIASITLDRQALAVDYLSNIRTICRAEEIRNQLNSKRGNRFYHYLQNFRFFIGTVKLSNILSAACKVLQKTCAVTNLKE